MSLRLIIEGSNEKVSTFVELLQQLCQYRFYHQSKCSISKDELRFEYYFDERKSIPPSLIQSDVKTLKFIDHKEQEIEITLLGCNAVEIKDGTTIVYGRSYDIFAG
jgi:hypothetical protein